MRDEFLNFLLLLAAELFLSNLVRAEHFHETGHVFDQDVIARDHYFLVTAAGGAGLCCVRRCGWSS